MPVPAQPWATSSHLLSNLFASISVAACFTFAGGAASATYLLEYGVVGNGSTTASAGSGATAVEVVSVTTGDGIAATKAASLSYSVEPVVGSTVPSESSVSDWCLY